MWNVLKNRKVFGNKRIFFSNLNKFKFSEENKDNFCFSKRSILMEEKPDILEDQTKVNLGKANIDNFAETIKIEERELPKIIAMEVKTKTENFKKDLMELTKFKLCVLNTMVSVSTFAYYMAPIHGFYYFGLFTFGTLTISMTTQVLNQIIEKLYDKKMRRTLHRPLPKQRIKDSTAWIVAASLWSASTLAYFVSFPHAILFSNLILALYILGYTPLKRINNLSMHIGAVVGALPALLGSYAVTGLLGLDEALLLAGYILCWQYPHFYGILYPNREDYQKAGFQFISNNPDKTYIAYIQMLIASVAILFIVHKLYEKKILNKVTYASFLGFYAYNMIPILMFIKSPNKYAKTIRIRSYTPFLIILLSFMFSAIKKRTISQS